MSDVSQKPIPAAALHQAAQWYVRRDAGALSRREEAAFAGWLAADPANLAAYERMEDSWDAFDRVPPSEAPRAVSATASPPARWRRPVLAAMAACLLVAAVFAGGLRREAEVFLLADAATAVGEARAVTLPDGSRVHLNTDSAIAVQIGAEGQRKVRLLKGEASFTVTKNADRPFTVTAGGVVSRVLGTVFTMRARPGGASVTLLEGSVAVSSGGGPETVLAANQRVTFRDGGAGAVEAVDPGMAAAWRRGKLAFQDRPLGEVIAELNRYHPGVIRIMGADLAARPVSGLFDTADPIAAVDAIEAALGIRTTRLTDRLVLLRP